MGARISLKEASVFVPGYVGKDHAARRALLRLAATHDDGPPRTAVDQHPDWEERLAAVEKAATCARFFSQWEIPHAYQSPQYRAWRARATGHFHSPRPLAQARPQARRDGAPLLILHDRVLRRPLGGYSAFAEQLAHLLGEVRNERLRFRVLPPTPGFDDHPYFTITELLVRSPRETPQPPVDGYSPEPPSMRLYVCEGPRLTYSSGIEGIQREGAFLNQATALCLSQDDSVRLLERAHERYAAMKRAYTKAVNAPVGH
ncbi:Scr1 family TA system antitoxin-like transcriptional regulator [Streptomyces anulatus]|uniref:Scr1 family TA system antitoxin-like transcriptional regulator n=1 Tax=Streptomyces anulatus TaxID=1892 RepID=UPI0033E5F98F